MRLSDIAKAVKDTGKPQDCWNAIIYGDPKVGKSRLAATICKVPYIENVHFFTVENGTETLLNMLRDKVITEEHANKIIVYDIPDTPKDPYGFETISKIITSEQNWVICEKHGRCSCDECATRGPEQKISGATARGKILEFTGQKFNLAKCTKNDVVIVDNLTQLSRSILAWTLKGKDYEFKPGWDNYGPQGRVLGDVLSIMQACVNTNFIATSHRCGIDFTATGQRATAEESATEDSVTTKYYPSVGSKNFSLIAAGFFSHVIYVEQRLNVHKAASRTDYHPDILTGSRGGWRLEEQKELDLSVSFEKIFGIPKPV